MSKCQGIMNRDKNARDEKNIKNICNGVDKYISST